MNSAAMCCASAALPPLPNTISLPPPRYESTTDDAAAATASAESASREYTSIAASMRERTRSAVIGPPGAQPLVLERELRHLRAELLQAVGHAVLAVIAA